MREEILRLRALNAELLAACKAALPFLESLDMERRPSSVTKILKTAIAHAETPK